jgi:rsbT co-antagonist protein RsbR
MDTGASSKSRFTFQIRLILALAFLSLLVAAIATAALLGIINLRASAQHASADSEESRLASEIVVDALLCRRYEKDFFLSSGNLAAQDAPLQKWHQSSIALRGAIKAYEDAASTEADQQRARAWREIWSQYTRGFGRVEIAINVGEIKTPQEALATFEPFQANIQALTDEAVQIAQQKTSSAKQTWQELDAAGINTTWLVAIIAGLVFAASIACSLLFPAWLSRPIKALHEAAVRLASGDLTARVGLSRNDELGVLAQSFDQMAAAMQRNTADLEAQYADANLARSAAEQASAKIAGQLAMIEQQRAIISEMSVPILPLTESTLIMPLVGALDSARIAQAQERALHTIQQAAARKLILDITGVPIVDTQVALGLMQIVQAAQLLGCAVTLVGIRPEVAQAIVGLGISLTGVETLGTLQSGIAHALRKPEQAALRR